MRHRLAGQRGDHLRLQGDRLDRRVAAVEPEIERHLVFTRSPRLERRARGRDLGQPALHRGVDVFVGGLELEVSLIELALDPAQAALYRDEPRARHHSRCRQAPRVGDAARDVVGVELIVDRQRRRETLELRQHAAAEATTPQASALLRYGVSLFASPSSLPKSRAWRRPWTRADVRTPMPHSLMKPAAADWSNSSPLP